MSGLLRSHIREFVPRVADVPSNPLKGDRRQSSQNALGSSRIMDCLLVDGRSFVAINTGDGIVESRRAGLTGNPFLAKLSTHPGDAPSDTPT